MTSQARISKINCTLSANQKSSMYNKIVYWLTASFVNQEITCEDNRCSFCSWGSKNKKESSASWSLKLEYFWKFDLSTFKGEEFKIVHAYLKNLVRREIYDLLWLLRWIVTLTCFPVLVCMFVLPVCIGSSCSLTGQILWIVNAVFCSFLLQLTVFCFVF